MIILLTKSILFTQDPAVRFSKRYDKPVELWKEIYRRYKIMGYTVEEAGDLYHVKTGSRINSKALRRWIWRSEIYEMSIPVVKRGCEVVKSDFFKHHEDYVVSELTKNISGAPNNRVVL